jgi:hypothetical protein
MAMSMLLGFAVDRSRSIDPEDDGFSARVPIVALLEAEGKRRAFAKAPAAARFRGWNRHALQVPFGTRVME